MRRRICLRRAMPMAMLAVRILSDTAARAISLGVNSGFGVQFSETRIEPAIDCGDRPELTPEPLVIQNIYFPTPQSANVGVLFHPLRSAMNGIYELYVSGGFENKVWIFRSIRRHRTGIRNLLGQLRKCKRPPLKSAKRRSFASGLQQGKRHSIRRAGGNSDGAALVTANNLGDNVTIVRGLRYRGWREWIAPSRKAEREHLPDGVVLGSGNNSQEKKAYVCAGMILRWR